MYENKKRIAASTINNPICIRVMISRKEVMVCIAVVSDPFTLAKVLLISMGLMGASTANAMAKKTDK